MTPDPFFDPLVAQPSGTDEPPANGAAPGRDGDVDEWFERAASGRPAGPGEEGGPSPSEQLGAAALPLEGDLVRPARRQRNLRRAPDAPLPTQPRDHQRSLPKRRSRALAIVALGTGVFLVSVVFLMRPASPVPEASPPKAPVVAPVPLRTVSPEQSVASAAQQRATRRLERRRAAARRRLAQRRAAVARRERAARTRRAAPRRPARGPTAPARPRVVAPPTVARPPAPPPAVSPGCVEFPPC